MIINERSDYNGKKRSELPDNVFGIPELRKYPMVDKESTLSAIKLFNHVDKEHEEELAKAMIKNMKKYNIDPSVVGPNNRLRKYLPKDMIKEEYVLKEAETPIRNIIFDIGSVLIKCDFEKAYQECKVIPEEYKDEVLRSWWLSDEVTFKETCSRDEYLDMVTKRVISPEAKPYVRVMLELYMEIIRPYHYANKLIYDLKESGYNVYFLSNWDKWSSTTLIETGAMEFLKDMKGGIFSWEVQKTKPNKDIYEEFINRFNVNPAECLFLDDKKENVDAAISVGMKGMVFYPKTTPNYLYENFIHKSYTESMLSEYGTTAGTVVGSDQADSVYIVNYMKKNTFNPEPRLGICKYGMKDLHIKGGKYDRIQHINLDDFEDEAFFL